VRGSEGTLPASLRWILCSPSPFLDKPNQDEPRPIRCGEWLRKVIARFFLERHRPKIRQTMLRLRQYGVMIPGGAEALYHAFSTTEELAQTGKLGSFVAVDVDMINLLGSVVWEATEAAYHENLPKGTPWVQWCQAEAVDINLPCKENIKSNRGAGMVSQMVR